MSAPHEVKHPSAEETVIVNDKAINNEDPAVNSSKELSSETPSESGDELKQAGVLEIEAITTAWTYRSLIITYICIYICSYNHSMQQQMNSNLAPYVTSSFRAHGLTATTGVVSGLVAGVSRLPIAKLLDIWGRIETFIMVNLLCSLGLILMAVCQNVETYAAAQVFWAVGSTGIGFIITVIISDTTSLKNRIIIVGLNSTAYIGNSFAGPAVAQLFYKHSTFRWAFGAFAIIVPFIAAPIVFMFWLNLRKAKNAGFVPKKSVSGRNWTQSIYFYAREFDVMGMFLIVAGFSLLLLPLSLASRSINKWKSAYIIAMFILGAVLLVVFGLWEKFFAPVPFFPWKFLKDRTILGASAFAGVLFISHSSWDSYFSSYLQVVHQQSIREAGYIINIYTIASCTWGPIVGVLIRLSGRFKWIAMCALPIACLGTALLIYFRQPSTPIGYIIMCQIFKATASGTLILCEQMAVMAAVGHNEVAVVLALVGLSSSIGGSIGRSISGSIWTNELPEYLERYLPEDAKANITTIYGSLPVQLSYDFGSPIRDAIVHAYGDTQRKMVIAGASFMPVALACIFLWKNINVANIHQTKGQVF